MSANIEVNEKLINEAMRLSKVQTKKEVVDIALKHFLAHLKRQNMKTLFGKVKWEGNLTKMRGG